MHGYEAVRLSHHGWSIAVRESRPDGVLPASVEGFDVGREASRQRRSKHRRDLQRRAHPDHSTKRAWPSMISLKDSGIVELRVPRKTDFTPVVHQALHRGFRRDLFDGPCRTQTSVKTDAGQHIHPDPATNDEILNAVEVVDVGSQRRDIGQRPASRRGLVSDSLATIQRTSSRQDPGEGGHGRNCSRLLFNQLTMNRCGTVLAKVAFGPQRLPNRQHTFLNAVLRSTWQHSTTRRSSLPIHLVQRPLSRASHPPLNGTQRHPKRTSHLAQPVSFPHPLHHLPPPINNRPFFHESISTSH